MTVGSARLMVKCAAGACAALAAIALTIPASAQDVSADVETESNWAADYITGIEKSDATKAACDDFMARADKLNSPDLLRGAHICGHAERPAESNFLLVVGQNRFLADASLTIPAAQEDARRQISIYGFIYYAAGGLGDKGVYRDPAAIERLLSLYDGWAADYGKDYDFGWQVRQRSGADEYDDAISELQANRRAEMIEYSDKLSDDEYYRIDSEIYALMAKTGGVFEAGSDESSYMDNLQLALEARSAELGYPVADYLPAEEMVAEAGDDNTAFELAPAPAPGETVLTDFEDGVVRKCARSAEFSAIAGGGEILATLVTSDAYWGTIYRADVSEPDRDTDRFVCTSNSTLSRPLEMGDEALEPLNQ